MEKYIILDTETTGLDKQAEIIEIAMINQANEVLLDTLVKPTQTIPDEVIAIHGITNDMVRDAPTWQEIIPVVKSLLKNNKSYAYNAPFDTRLIKQSSEKYGLFIQPSIHCVMKAVIDNLHLDCEHFPLAKAASQYNLSFDGLIPHRALSDCKVTLDVLCAIKKTKISI